MIEEGMGWVKGRGGRKAGIVVISQSIIILINNNYNNIDLKLYDDEDEVFIQSVAWDKWVDELVNVDDT